MASARTTLQVAVPPDLRASIIENARDSRLSYSAYVMQGVGSLALFEEIGATSSSLLRVNNTSYPLPPLYQGESDHLTARMVFSVPTERLPEIDELAEQTGNSRLDVMREGARLRNYLAEIGIRDSYRLDTSELSRDVVL